MRCRWASFTALSVLAGAAFAAINQGLVAAFGAVGRIVALLIAVVALVGGIATTVPPLLAGLAGALPTAAALGALRAAFVAMDEGEQGCEDKAAAIVARLAACGCRPYRLRLPVGQDANDRLQAVGRDALRAELDAAISGPLLR